MRFALSFTGTSGLNVVGPGLMTCSTVAGGSESSAAHARDEHRLTRHEAGGDGQSELRGQVGDRHTRRLYITDAVLLRSQAQRRQSSDNSRTWSSRST